MQENRMINQPVGKLLLSTGIPVMCSMTLQAVYNIVDSAFVSNIEGVGEQALNALTLAFPIQMLMIAFAVGLGLGACVIFSRYMGQQKQEQANYVAGNAQLLSLMFYCVFLLFGIFGVEAYIASQSTNPVIVEMAVDYLRICCIMSFGFALFGVYEKLLQSTGLSIYSTIAQVTGAVINIVLDTILIFGLFGMPALGVKGAAYATVIGQIGAMLTALFFHCRKNHQISKSLRYMRPKARIIKGIFAVGLPAMIAQGLISVTAYLLNIIFVQISETVVTVYGLFYKIQQFVLMAIFGLRDASTPILACAYGMKSIQRVNDSIKYSLLYTSIIMGVGTIVFELFATPITQAFGLSGEAQALCVLAIRWITLSFLFAGANIAIQGMMQSLNCGVESLVISASRQFVFIIPVAYGLTQWVIQHPDQTWLVWITFLIAEGITVILSVVLLKRTHKKKIKTLATV